MTLPAHSPVGAKIYVAMAGLLTYPNLFAPSQNLSSNDILQQGYRDLQQRVLFRTFTEFPFHPPAFAWRQPYRPQNYKKYFITSTGFNF